jgi:hypothetical protein
MTTYGTDDDITHGVLHTTFASNNSDWLGALPELPLSAVSMALRPHTNFPLTAMVSNKDLAAFFFSSLGQGQFRCNLCGNTRKQLTGSGYSNLMAHLAGKHPGNEDQYASQLSNSSRPLQAFGFVGEETSHLFQWVRWIVERNMPVHEVEDVLTRSMSKLRPVTAKAVKACMGGIAAEVGKLLRNELGTLFGLMFDGWSHAGVHYVALYAVYVLNGKLRLPLLGISPLADGTQTAVAHIELFENLLDVYEKTKDMVAFLVGDNCSTNLCIANKMGVPLVGCASHRLNLAVNKFLVPYEDALDEVHTLMIALRNENNLAELKKHTELNPIKRNVTRWSSTFEMVERYIRIRAAIKKVDAVEELIPTGAKHRKLVGLLEHLKKFNSICKRLQRDDTDMAEVRLMFDALVAEYPVMAEHLKSTAKIIHTPAFESGVVKVIAGSALSPAETAALKRFEVALPTGKKRTERDEDYASLLLQDKGKKRKHSASSPSYSPLVAMVPPTSNTVERLFSQCKLVMTPERRSMLPANFERLSFLRVNRSMWDVTTVARISSDSSS